MARGAGKAVAGLVLALVAGGLVAAPPASARPIPPAVTKNPTPLTDIFASVLPPLTGGTTRLCATSDLGIPVHCVENVTFMPSASPGSSGVTFAHWIYCKNVCAGRLLAHEMVHVHQFEWYGDIFGPMYLAEAAQHGTGCENVYERRAYESTGSCP